jgi:hypothetical protein
MPTNTTPIFTGTPVSPFGTAVTAANTAMDGTGTVTTVFTADATNGGFCGLIKLKPLGTNVASVARFFKNNGVTNATASNNVLIGEVTLPATTASAVAALIELAYPVLEALQAGYKINMTLGTAVAAGWIASAEAGSYTKG